MKTDSVLLARLLETTRHFWGLGLAPLSDEKAGVHVDADQPATPFSVQGPVNKQILFA